MIDCFTNLRIDREVEVDELPADFISRGQLMNILRLEIQFEILQT